MTIYKKGETLFRQGETGPLFLLKDGLLKVTRLKEDGTSTLVNLILPDEVFPHHSLLTPNEYFGTAIAAIKCEVKIIPSSDWYDQLENNPQRLRETALLLQNKLRMMQQRIDQLSAFSPSEKFLLFRQWFHSYFPDLVLEEVLTQEEIGQFIGLRRETVNRMLRKL
ncbi:Crp/Fnr family transcriptional regulator [Salipaludibacillus neizhouensis]|uniref:Crp/Fnr family transcriptional regulator n=1 Tax=Salipaludibacillus neizhouensis TaxID=885475 RepID=A0A3A9JV08_9BACI|nr:Crp/Fnr family transcriptional regulator [Salipaludibacillus neizhouensis]RKL64764.1 Crp/Fnr family transcriptional regulator [Salipaludibacillus neizhouensis]